MTVEEIKVQYSMRDIVSQYGLKINRAGFCACPFHNEKDASLKVYKDSFYCFGCGASGDIFSFVQAKENVDFKMAFKRLGGTYGDASKTARKWRNYRLEKLKETERLKAEKKKQRKQEILKDIKDWKLIKRVNPVFSDDWCAAVNRLEYDFYLLEEMEKR